VAATIWLFSNSIYIADQAYRTGLKVSWRLKHGPIKYETIFTPQKMVETHKKKKGEYLGSLLDITGKWKSIETKLENSLIKMFDRTDKMKGWEIKKIGSDAWHDAARQLKQLKQVEPNSPFLDRAPDDMDMNNVLIYNRLSKSGSTFLMSIIYKLRERLSYLVLRGKYHSYRYFRDNDRKGLGHFLEQASSRAKTLYIQHQFYINFTQFHIDQPRYINIVRDPLEQFISWYYYRRTTVLFNRSPENMTTEERKIIGQSLEECVVERRLECVYYGYTTPKNKTNQLDFRKRWNPDFFHPNDVMMHFCGHAPECGALGSPLALQRAKYNVEHHFSVVGVLEHLEESAAVLEHQLPQFFTGMKQLVKEEGVKNKNSLKNENVSQEIRDTLIYRFADLFELYNFIKQKLFRQYSQIK